MTAPIPFTQYQLPHGRPKTIYIHVDDETAAKAAAILALGLQFEIEVLRTGEVSMTVYDPMEDVDIDIRVVPNGPEVPVAVVEMIRGFTPPAVTVQ